MPPGRGAGEMGGGLPGTTLAVLIYLQAELIYFERPDAPIRIGLHKDTSMLGRFALTCALGFICFVVAGADEDPAGRTPATPRKSASAFFPAEVLARARDNAANQPWGQTARDSIVAAAQPWLRMSDEGLWDLMFSNRIKRSWMVWSNGHCPACKQPVPMYEWTIDALGHPWKVQCPRCGGSFPKNDFQAFYRSGLNEQAEFVPESADRSLLWNAEHPDPHDPLHQFGVDDGEGYVEGDLRWRFIGAYLIYGQWKQAVVGRIRRLADAYVVTGDVAYAHKAGVLLDRVADLYPTFDFGKEGVMYEGPPSAGYVSTWHDACLEVYDLALAYDAVFDALAHDESLLTFLNTQAETHRLPHSKRTFAEVQQNIEDRIFRDTLANRPKIESNYPSTDVTLVTLHTVLGWPTNRSEVTLMLDAIVRQATAVDGLSGEKGLAGYATIAPRTVAGLLGRYARVDPQFLRDVLQRHPALHAMFRFHIDTWCLGRYYPSSGDTGAFAQQCPSYAGLDLSRGVSLQPSAFTFLWDLYAATDDLDLVRILYTGNARAVEGLPYDLCAADPAVLQQQVAKLMAEQGETIQLGSVHKPNWCLGILRSGTDVHSRAVWLDYDSGGRHGHADALNLGVFAKDLDLMPDFGYPPVQYGGWSAPRAQWYTQSAAHSTVVIDGQNSRVGAGQCTAWMPGRECQWIKAAAPQLVGTEQFDRCIAMVDVSPQDFYVMDLFRVVGGVEHTKYVHSHFGTISSSDLTWESTSESWGGETMRGFRKATHPPGVWIVDWAIDDHLKYLAPGRAVHFRYTDLTGEAEVWSAEGWVAVGLYGGTADAWIPRVMVRRRASQGPLSSTFVGLMEPYEGQSVIKSVRRVEPQRLNGEWSGEADVALEVQLTDGRRDVLFARGAGTETATSEQVLDELKLNDLGITLDGAWAWIRFGADGSVQRLFLGHGQVLEVGAVRLERTRREGWIEVDLSQTDSPFVSGEPSAVRSLDVGTRRLWPR